MKEPNFQIESNRIAAAFSATGEWKIFNAKHFSVHRIGGCAVLAQEGGILWFRLYDEPYKLSEKGSLSVNVNSGRPRLNSVLWRNPALMPRMACALYCLGYDISQLEEEFNLTISAHERLEWMLEFKTRLALQNEGTAR